MSLTSVCLEPYKTTVSECFCENIAGLKPLTIFVKKLYHRCLT